MSSFTIQNFGCRASQADGSALATELSGKGFAQVRGASDAQFVILNTCTVTSAADDELRQIVRRVHRENPDARIVVTGCYAQRAPEEISGLPGVEMVVGNSHKTRTRRTPVGAEQRALPRRDSGGGHLHSARVSRRLRRSKRGQDKSRPNLKIQDGCNNRCSFCIIPFVRGRSRSAPADAVIEQVRELSKTYSEVVLTGINLGRWGREPFSSVRLADLLRRMLAETDVELAAPQFGGADGLVGRPARAGGGVAAGSRSMCTRRCSRDRMRCCGGCTASTGRGTMRTGC